MKLIFYKTALLIELFFILCSLVFFSSVSVSSTTLKVEIPTVHPYEFYLVSLSGCILLFVSSLIALLIVVSKGNTPQKEEETEPSTEGNPKNLFWKYSFLVNGLLSFLILGITFYTFATLDSQMIIYQPHLFKNYVYIICIAQFTISLLTGAIFNIAGLLWLKNKVVASVVVIVGLFLFILPLGYLTYFKSYTYHDQANASYYQEVEEASNAIATGAIEVEEEHYDMGEEYEEYEEGEEEDYFSFSDLWEDPSEDEENVRSATSIIRNIVAAYEGNNYLGYMRHVYDPRSNNEAIEKNTPIDYFHKIKEKLLNNPEVLQSAFDNYKHLLYETISVKTYIRNDVDVVIELLLLSYYDIQSDDNAAATLEEVNRIMTSHPKNEYNYEDDATDFYPEIKDFVSEKMLEKYSTLKYSNKYNVTKGDIVWAYSFWARRNKEGTMQSVLTILTEVKKHYDAY